MIPKNIPNNPAKGNKYMKFQEGENKLRILSNEIMGWVYWTEADGKKSPVRVTIDEFKNVDRELQAESKFFLAFLVWNYKTESAEVLEITQKGIQNAFAVLEHDSDWDDLKSFDIVITRHGEGLETEYQTNPKPKKAFDKKGKDIPTVHLEALFEGGDPFKNDIDIDEAMMAMG